MIHIGANGHTPQTLRNLANIMASHESLLADALRLDRGRMNRYCRTVDPDFLRQLNRRKPQTMAALADVWYRGNGADYGRSQHYNDSRYHMLNLHATFTKEKDVDNDKYAFRCFLLRLGFIGAEYKAERKILLKNLTGSSAFRNGGAEHADSEQRND